MPFTMHGERSAIGNAIPMAMGRAVAQAVQSGDGTERMIEPTQPLEQHHWAFDGVAEWPPADTTSGLRRAVPKLLGDVVRVIGMTAIAPPAFAVHEVPAILPCGNGLAFVVRRWAGLQLIAESHIAVHGGARYLELDVFSCKAFNLKHVAAALAIWFGDGPLFLSQARRGPNVGPAQTVVREEPAFVLLRGRLLPIDVVEAQP